MLITLNDRTYRVVRMNGKSVVVVDHGPQSRLMSPLEMAEPSIAALVLAGLTAPVFA